MQESLEEKSNQNAHELTTARIEELINDPVTLCIFLHPVVLIGSGQTVEEDTAKRALINKQCPITRNPISGYEPNFLVKSFVDEYLKLHPDEVDNQYNPERDRAIPHSVQQEKVIHSPRLFRPRAQFSLPVAIYFFSATHCQRADLIKGICLGQEGSNKQNFLSALRCDNTILDQSTIGVDLLKCLDHSTQLQVWNITGQNNFAPSQRAYYRNASFALLFAQIGELERIQEVIDEIFTIDSIGELFWIRNNNDRVEFVPHQIFENLPHRQMRNNCFVASRTLESREECQRIGIEILQLAQQRIPNKIFPNMQHGPDADASKEGTQSKNCILM